eukprot:2650850-Prymnesium_polylepis.1
MADKCCSWCISILLHYLVMHVEQHTRALTTWRRRARGRRHARVQHTPTRTHSTQTDRQTDLNAFNKDPRERVQGLLVRSM